jgi:hypothetical protein
MFGDQLKPFFYLTYHLVNEYMHHSSEAFPGLDHECRREVLGSEPRFYMIVSADSFSNQISTRSFRSHNVNKCLDYSVTEYEQRVTTKFLTNEFADVNEIHKKLSAQFGEHTWALHTIEFWVREIQGGREDLRDEHQSGRPVFDYIGTKILSILEKESFESAHSIAHILKVDLATVLHHLHEKLESKSYDL